MDDDDKGVRSSNVGI